MLSTLISAVFMIESVRDNIPSILSLQGALIERFFHNVNQDKMQEISDGEPLLTICDWKKKNTDALHPYIWIECTDGIIRTLTINNHLDAYAIEYLPNTIEHVEITSASLYCSVNTRDLPLQARNIILRNNGIKGSIELCALPPYVEEFDISMNRITGTITLTDLPRGLKRLKMSSNNIEQRTLYYAKLPPNFWTSLEGNVIGEIRPVWPSQKADKRTFYGISKRHIH